MDNEQFYKLVELIFKNTFGIKEHKNGERGGAFPDLFPTYQLGRDLKAIKDGKPIPDPSIYIAAIDGFFKSDDCIKKTKTLIETLEAKGYLLGLDGADISAKCDQHTINLYRNLILSIWNYYYGQYSDNNQNGNEVYSIPQNVIDEIIAKHTKYSIQKNIFSEYYKNRIPEIIDSLKSKNPDSVYSSIKIEYIYFFKKVIEDNSFYTLSHEERVEFFNALYTITDILDRIHHEDVYNIALEMLTFFNIIYNDNFTDICVDDIRRIQGCIYSILIEPTDKSLCGNIRLTDNNNLIRVDSGYNTINYATKLKYCNTALNSLLTNKKLSELNACFNEDGEIQRYEIRLSRNRPISSTEINELHVLSLIYSNIAACTLQYIKHEIDISLREDEYIDTCEKYHFNSEYIRTLILRITQKMNGKESSEYLEALHFLAAHYNSVAYKNYHIKKYSDSILIRSVLYSFYMTLGLKEKASMQLELAPITLYENNGGNSDLYEVEKNKFIEKHGNNFSYLYNGDLISYDVFSHLVFEHHKSKESS